MNHAHTQKSFYPLFLAIAGMVAVAVLQQIQFNGQLQQIFIFITILLASFCFFMLLNKVDQSIPWKKMAALASVLFGLFYIAISDTTETPILSADIHLSDQNVLSNSAPAPMGEREKFINGYILHPAFDGAIVPSSVIVKIPEKITTASLLISRPKSVNSDKNDAPIESDGISLEVTIFDTHGNPGMSQTLNISSEQFLSQKWIEHPLWNFRSMSRVEVLVRGGPPGSTTTFDTTQIAFKVLSLTDHLDLVSTTVLASLYLFVLLLVIASTSSVIKQSFNGMTDMHWPLAHGILLLMLLAFYVYWTQSRTTFIYFWDYRNYWEKTETLFKMMNDQQWLAALQEVKSSLTANYSAVPAIPMALLSLAIGPPERIPYSIILTAIYTTPAYLSIVYLAKKIYQPLSLQKSKNFHWSAAGLLLVLAIPQYFGTTLLLMPDIGGVTILVGALLLATKILSEIQSTHTNTHSTSNPSHLISASLCMGFLLALMFLFRRWYVFGAVGLAGATVSILLFDLVQRPTLRRQLASRSMASALMVACGALPFLGLTILSWSAAPERHNYSSLYSSYQLGLSHAARAFIDKFGIINLAICLYGIFLITREQKTRQLAMVLLISTLLAATLFLSIQSPGRHHFYLLMPLLGVTFLISIWHLNGNFSRLASTIVMAAIVLGGVFLPRIGTIPLFASYQDWAPRQQPYFENLKSISKWLDSEENRSKSFCVIASSRDFNQETFRNLWQIDPRVGRYSYESRLISLGQVDSVNGPVSRALMNCEIFLVGTPFQHHLAKEEQFTLEIVQQDLLSGRGVGQSIDRDHPGVWDLGDGIRIVAYQRVRPITDVQYTDLVKRFWGAKQLRQSSSS